MATWPANDDTDWNTKMLAYLAVEHETDGTHKTSAMDALIKGWVRFDGATGDTATEKDSFNVSGIVRDSEGLYTISWDTNFSDANYCVVGTCHIAAQAIGVVRIVAINTGSVQISTIKGAGTVEDADIVCIMAIGAQA